MTERVAHIKCLIPQWLEVKKIKYTLENIKKKKKKKKKCIVCIIFIH